MRRTAASPARVRRAARQGSALRRGGGTNSGERLRRGAVRADELRQTRSTSNFSSHPTQSTSKNSSAVAAAAVAGGGGAMPARAGA
ncbi:hypothetical protein ZWY2020_013435 [Hordeum vulgare]|nr:hypothetical protein ZWY2020_013435 [Hordeum vulgare]